MSFLLNLSRAQKRSVLLGTDVALVPVALLSAASLHFGLLGAWPWFAGNWAFTLLMMTVAAGCSYGLGIFRIRLKAFDRSAVVQMMGFAALLGAASLVLAMFAGLGIPFRLHMTFCIAFFLLSTGSRYVMLEVLLNAYRANGHVTSVMIYGAGKTGMQLASALKSHPDIIPVGFVDDSLALRGQTVGGLPVYHGARLEEVLVQTNPDRVVIAMPSASRKAVAKIERRVERTGVKLQVLPSFAQLVGQEEARGTFDDFLGRENLHEDIAIGFQEYVDQSVMVTGAGGSIGSELCRQILRCHPKSLILFEQNELALYDIEMELSDLARRNNVALKAVLGSISDAPLLRDVMQRDQIDVIFHAAAYKHVPMVQSNPLVGLKNNVLGTATLAAIAKEQRVARFVLISTDKAVQPVNVMGASKRFAEMIVQDHASRQCETAFSIVRFGNVLGSSGSVVPLFQDQVARGGPVTLTHPEVTRYFMSVQEAAQLVLTSGGLGQGGEIFVLDMGKPVPVLRLAEQVIEAAGYSVRNADYPDGDIEIITTGLRPGEKMHEELTGRGGKMTTSHEKIFCVQDDCLSELELAAALKQLRDAVAQHDEDAAIAAICRWIEGYSFPLQQVQ